MTKIYDKVRSVPNNALKTIGGGRLKGMSDINPMWRIKTQVFGPCGIGWKYVISNKQLERGANDEIAAFVDIDLFVRDGEKWSEAVPGTGGSMFVTKEKNGLYTSDECYKMALTDALSVACKALGVAADVYWDKDNTKYNRQAGAPTNGQGSTNTSRGGTITKDEAGKLFEIAKRNVGIVKKVTIEYGYQKTTDIKKEHYTEICDKIEILAKEHEA